MILFALPRYERLAGTLEELARPRHGRCTIGRFANGELHAAIDTAVTGHDCIVLGSVAPPDESLLSTLLLGHTVKKEGARTVLALLPYLGYARHDRVEAGKSLATAWVGELLRASGIDRVASVDVHSRAAHELFPIPLASLSPARLLAAEITAGRAADVTIVAPDEGARERCEAVRCAAGIDRPVVHLAKRRTPEGVVHERLEGDVSRHAVVVDDILDTGGTLVSACEMLRQARVERITVMVSHGLFTGTRWEALWSVGVERIYCLDTVPLPPRVELQPVVVLSVASLLAEHLRTLGAAALA
jgi:ribose-phosphate pyrophosphokinase